MIIDNVVTGNYSGDDGGGVRVFESAARIERNRIEDNEAADSGGGVRISHVASRVIDNVVRGNRAQVGGGMDLDNDASVIRGGLVAGNRASGSGGGISVGLWPWTGGAIEDVQLLDNEAGSRGGALYVDDNFQPLELRGLTIRGNKAGPGGGLFVRSTTYTLANSVFDGNRATGDGGAIHVAARAWTDLCPCPPASPTGTIDFVVAHGNVAASGSALWTADVGLSIESSILSANDGRGVVVAGVAPPIWRFNLALPRAFSGMADPTGAAGNVSADPRFVAPAAANFALASGCPAIDAGDPPLHDRNGTRADLGLFGGAAGGPAACATCPAPAFAAVLVADAHVASGQPAVNFGGAAALETDTSPQTEAFVRFQVSGVTAPIASARLRLSVTNGTVDAPQVFAAGSAWAESGIT